MKNSIRSLKLQDRRLTSAEAEIWVLAEAEHLTPGTELRGRFVGPRCQGRSTVEVAYPLRPLPPDAATPPGLSARVVIPDPCFWSAEEAFQYDGQLELWQDGKRWETCRVALRLGHTGQITTVSG